MTPAGDLPSGFAATLVAWQTRGGRHGLPWQHTRDPYRVWLSEIMLQQTQVTTVLAYYPRFLDRFPNVAALASAPLDDVLGMWSGLGYYSRARNLHRCAQAVVTEHGGSFPSRADVLQTLPGIGRSTAAAIAAFCFNERISILDGNVKRVLTRVLGYPGDLALATHERRLWGLANELVPPQDAADTMPRYTQALMDLGATICTPRKPACAQCPVAVECRAKAEGQPEVYPVKSRKLKRSSASHWLMWCQRRDGAVWLQQRPGRGIWAGLFCFPLFDSLPSLHAALPGIPEGAWHTLPAFKHVLTHKDMHLHPVVCTLDEEAAPPQVAGQWVTATDWPALGLPAPVRRLLSGVG